MNMYWVSVTVTMVAIVYLNLKFDPPFTKVDYEDIYMQVLCVSLFVLVTIPILIKIGLRLMMKSTSQDLKIKILKRHLLYTSLYMLFVF